MAVPEEVAVVGVDNEELVCQLAYPPLSSVVPDAKRIGYEAAGLLDRMMKGEPPRRRLALIPPVSVVIRQSSDVTAIADPRLAEALRFIREHACEGIRVDDVLEHASLSRSALQRLFRKDLDKRFWTRSPTFACSACVNCLPRPTFLSPKSPTAQAMPTPSI